MAKKEKKVTGYDKYVDWKMFSIPVVLFFVLLLIPTPYGMKDVGTEYRIGPKAVIEHITQALFDVSSEDAQQWQLLTAQIMENNLNKGALSRSRYLKRDLKWCGQNKIKAEPANFEQAHIDSSTPASATRRIWSLMQAALTLRKDELKYENLSAADRAEADKGAWHIKVAIAMGVFVVLCFLTECIPLPGVSFCIGLILVFTGVTSRKGGGHALLG
jgi:sodium-dependent dicarboxylate transporter 2/3/5